MSDDPERRSEEEDLVANRHLSDDSVDKPFDGQPYSSEEDYYYVSSSSSPSEYNKSNGGDSSSEFKSNGDDGPNYVSKIKIVLITKKKKEDTEKTTTTKTEEEESVRTVENVESLLNKINREFLAIEKEKEEESERESLVETMQMYVNDASENFGWKPQIIRVDEVLALEKMNLMNIICYVVEDIFYPEISLNLGGEEKLEFKGIPIIIFSLENDDKKCQKILWKGGGEDNIKSEVCELISVLVDILEKAAFKDEDGDENVEGGNGDENDEGSKGTDGDAPDDGASEEASAENDDKEDKEED